MLKNMYVLQESKDVIYMSDDRKFIDARIRKLRRAACRNTVGEALKRKDGWVIYVKARMELE